MDTQEMLTVKEAAKFLRCSERHLRQLIHCGLLTAYKPGKQYLLPRSSVLGYFRRSKHAPF